MAQKASHRTKKTPQNLTRFVATLAATCNVTESARAIGISRWLAYDWKRQSEDEPGKAEGLTVQLDEDTRVLFHVAWEDALGMGKDAVEAEVMRRGMHGWDEPVVHQGIIATRWCDERMLWVPVTVRKYSDTLLLALAKAHMPERYRERHDVNHSGKVDAGVLLIPSGAVDPDEWAAAVAKYQAKGRGES